MEKPVVATDVGGVRELVGETGVIVLPRNPEPLAQAMLRVMRTPLDERAAMVKAARQRICSRFDFEAKVDEWEKFYSQLLGASHRSSAESPRDQLIGGFQK
jgi:glycosyltransferase involved in cell wall biosynthesis